MGNELANNIFNSIIKEEGLFFRGVVVGDTLKKVVEKEGNDFKNKDGILPQYKYYLEIGEMEEIDMYYGYSKDSKKVNRIELMIKTYPQYYWEKGGGKDIVNFHKTLYDNQLNRYIGHFITVKERIILHFTELLGEPKISKKDHVFNLEYQNFSSYNWITKKNKLSIMSYIDDTNMPNAEPKMILKIELTKIDWHLS